VGEKLEFDSIREDRVVSYTAHGTITRNWTKKNFQRREKRKAGLLKTEHTAGAIKRGKAGPIEGG